MPPALFASLLWSAVMERRHHRHFEADARHHDCQFLRCHQHRECFKTTQTGELGVQIVQLKEDLCDVLMKKDLMIHAIRNFHVYGYLYVKLYWIGFGFSANIVDEYVVFAAMLQGQVAFRALSNRWMMSSPLRMRPLSTERMRTRRAVVSCIVFWSVGLPSH